MTNPYRQRSMDVDVRRADLERRLGPVRERGGIAQCIKCGWKPEEPEGFITMYCGGVSKLVKNDDPNACPIIGEHLHLQCNRCRFAWLEECADGEDRQMSVISGSDPT